MTEPDTLWVLGGVAVIANYKIHLHRVEEDPGTAHAHDDRSEDSRFGGFRVVIWIKRLLVVVLLDHL